MPGSANCLDMSRSKAAEFASTLIIREKLPFCATSMFAYSPMRSLHRLLASESKSNPGENSSHTFYAPDHDCDQVLYCERKELLCRSSFLKLRKGSTLCRT